MKSDRFFKEFNKDVNVVYLSPYIPRECGIATFTKQLTDAVNILNPDKLGRIIVVDDSNNSFEYPKEVIYRIQFDDQKNYVMAARYINKSKTEIVSIQHEFGLYGVDSGRFILDFINNLKKPFVITFHTVLSEPDEMKRKIVKEICEKSSAVIVMADEAVSRMKRIYGIKEEKIAKIPHGVPDIPFVPSEPYKNNLGIRETSVISTFGLLSPNKGIEYVIEAMPKVIEKAPKSIFLVIGKTHPNIQLEFGESYRQSLIKLAKRLRVQENVKFINKFLSFEEVIYYLQATDVYITPYLEPEQITSGTLAYALGAGKACISTPYAYAREVLSENRGCIVPFRDSRAISNKLIKILQNENSRIAYSRKGYVYGRKMIWENIAQRYLMVFRSILEK